MTLFGQAKRHFVSNPCHQAWCLVNEQNGKSFPHKSKKRTGRRHQDPRRDPVRPLVAIDGLSARSSAAHQPRA